MSRQRRAAAVLVAAGCLLVACGSESPEPGNGGGDVTQPPDDASPTSAAGTAAEVRATVEVQAEAGPGPEDYQAGTEGVTLSYVVRNDGDAAILVVRERGHRQSSESHAPDVPEAVWVSGGDADTVRVSKELFPVPSGIELHEPYRAPADLVEPGAEMTGTAFLPLPLRTDLPSGGETLVVEARPVTGDETRVELCLQVAPDPRVEHPDAFTDEITSGHGDRSLVCSEPIELPGGGD
jgi:hypothetical protein